MTNYGGLLINAILIDDMIGLIRIFTIYQLCLGYLKTSISKTSFCEISYD